MNHSNLPNASGRDTPESSASEPEEPNSTKLWQALNQNNSKFLFCVKYYFDVKYCKNFFTAMGGEATQLLRRLITCRKLGLTLTPSGDELRNGLLVMVDNFNAIFILL